MTDFQRDLDYITSELEIINNGKLKFVMKKLKVDTPIRELDLDTRGLNALLRAKIDTVGELIERVADVRKIRGVGMTVIKRIHTGFMSWYYDSLNTEEREEFWRDSIMATVELAKDSCAENVA